MTYSNSFADIAANSPPQSSRLTSRGIFFRGRSVSTRRSLAARPEKWWEMRDFPAMVDCQRMFVCASFGGVSLYIYIIIYILYIIIYLCVCTPFHEVSVSTLRVCISWTLTGSRRSNIFHFFQNVGLVFGASVDWLYLWMTRSYALITMENHHF